MKTYLLKNTPAVEPKAQPQPERQNPSAPTSLTDVSSRGSQPKALFIGLDVHSESIAVSIAPGDSSEVRRYGLIGGTHDDVLRLAKKLQAGHPEATLRLVYEGGPHGYPLCRCLRAHRYDCANIAPSKIPTAPRPARQDQPPRRRPAGPPAPRR